MNLFRAAHVVIPSRCRSDVPGDEEDCRFDNGDSVLEQLVVAQDGDQATRHHADSTRADERCSNGLHVYVIVQARDDERNA